LTIQLLREQKKYDDMLRGFFDKLQRILPLANKAAEDIVCEDREVLEKTITQMFEVMQRVAEFSCEYVKRGRFGRQSSFEIRSMLMIAERTRDGIIYSKDKEMIEELDGGLTRIIEDYIRAVDVETLRLAKRNRTYKLIQFGFTSFSVTSCRAKLPA
jgi:hypothetical protein